MPVKVPNNLPAVQVLRDENIFVMTEERATAQDIRDVYKRQVTGTGRADKMQVQAMVRAILGMREIPKPDDAADALAVAITHAHSMRAGALFKIV